MAAWRYCLDSPFRVRSAHLEGVEFVNEWVEIEGGAMTIRAGYAWDGCSPAWTYLGWWVGVWDGPLCPDGRPAAYFASLVHDALCQFAPQIPIKRDATVALFGDMLRERKFPGPLTWLYLEAVRRFGPQDFGKNYGLG